MRDVLAVVITYNRCDKLKDCIQSLRNQTVPCDILLIDNHSTDNTEAYIDALCDEKSITCIRTEQNIGGAGGFSLGIKLGYQRGYKYFWLMDDDACPYLDALERLLEADALFEHKQGFLYSKVVWTDKTLCKVNIPKLNGKRATNGYKELKQASFVSVMFTREVVKKVGIPIADYFIWGDDVEYTRRIAVRHNMPGYWVENSIVEHRPEYNYGSDISVDVPDRIDRYRYAFRNECYLYRQEGLKGYMYYYLKCCWNTFKIIIRAKDNKGRRIKVLIAAIKEGQTFNPSIEMVE